jgi:6-phosphogluconolactonase
MGLREIIVVPGPGAVAETAAREIAAASARACASGDRFSIALSGGNTPKAIYERLAASKPALNLDWTRWDVYFSDERTVPPDSDQSNYRMASEALLRKVPIAREAVHRMIGEMAPEQAAMDYGRLLKAKFGDGGLDLVMLGMGDDGHTASLFPHTTALMEAKHRCVANWVEKLQTWRLTMSAPFMNRAGMVMILVTGSAKADRLAEVLEGPRDEQQLPIQLISPTRPGARLLWILDEPAAAKLTSRS